MECKRYDHIDSRYCDGFDDVQIRQGSGTSVTTYYLHRNQGIASITQVNLAALVAMACAVTEQVEFLTLIPSTVLLQS